MSGIGIAKKGLGLLGKKIKGRKITKQWKRDATAKGLREHRASESYKRHKKTMKKIPHDLTYMKGILKD
jgi:hypothetical protein|tara:strand:+ start:304 stop:510 length:207 start_codon:yes stop_codon:yes gene_type:complete